MKKSEVWKWQNGDTVQYNPEGHTPSKVRLFSLLIQYQQADCHLAGRPRFEIVQIKVHLSYIAGGITIKE